MKMFKLYKFVSVIFICIFFAGKIAAQNNLTPGDIAFVSYQSDFDPTNTFTVGVPEFEDRFSIVVLKTGGLAAGTVIYFTDRGWNAVSNNWLDETYPPFTFGLGSEAVIKWTVPAGGIIQGKEVFFINIYHDELPAGSEYYEWKAFSDEAATIPLGTISNETLIVPPPSGPGITDGMNFSVSGDNILIYQTGPVAGPTGGYNATPIRFITAILTNIRTTAVPPGTDFITWDVTPSSLNESSLPPGLVNGQTAFVMSPGPLPSAVSNGTIEPDNGKFSNCSLSSAGTCTPLQMAAIIYNFANWTPNNNVFPLGQSSSKCTYTILPANTVTLTSAPGTNAQTVSVNTPIINITYATTGATGATFSGLPPGVSGNWSANVATISGSPNTTVNSPFNYTVNLTGGCGTVSDIGSITVNAPTCAVTGSGTTTPTTCAGGSNGTATITLTGTGAGAPGTYTVDGGGSQPYATNPFTVTGLTAGNHTIVATVTAGGCVSSNILVNVGTTTAFLATYVKTNLTSCSGTQDGSITVTPTGGTAPYTYAWTGITGSGNPATTVYPNPGNVSSISGLNIGYYNVTVTDAGGCGSVTISNIHVQFAFSVFITNNGSSSSACGSTGSVTLYGNAGVLPYTFALSAGSGQPTPAPGAFQAGNTFTGLAAGPYTGFVKDAGGCVSAKDITVGSIAAVAANPFAVASSSCNADGSIQIFKTGGVGPFTYSLNAGAYQTSNFFPGLAAGPYTANVKDGNGCIGSAIVTVGQGAGLTVTAFKTNTGSCVTNGTIQVNVTGGVAPYTYSINGGLYQVSNSFTGLGASTYAISVKDARNCTGSLNVTINTNFINVTAFPTAATSCASNDGKIQLFRTGGTGPYTYSIDGNIYQASTIFLGLAAGTYDGYVKDVFGCIGVLNGIVVGPTGCAPPPIAGNTKYSAPVQTSASLKLNAYPNPSNGAFTLQLDGYSMTEKVSVTVTDLMGRKVYQAEGTGKQQYRFGTNFISGMYNVQVIQGSEKKSLKLVKE